MVRWLKGRKLEVQLVKMIELEFGTYTVGSI